MTEFLAEEPFGSPPNLGPDETIWDRDGSERIPVEEDAFAAYVVEFVAENVGFIPIGTFLYAVQGWSKSKKEPTDKWYHLVARPVGDDVRIVCMCPDRDKDGWCVHSETYLEFREDRFHELEQKVF
ncbi:hypothetical protein V5O48_018677 [Marasmius crinis-equi]|uniref:SWIM-type domain-containing protein n=1 Tax=Marasmius crinis-equi TaxID=585013 RepID=A0ABR3EKH3_9AGAR